MEPIVKNVKVELTREEINSGDLIIIVLDVYEKDNEKDGVTYTIKYPKN